MDENSRIRRIEVIVRKGDQSVARFILAPGEYVVGRNGECDILIDCPDVSDRHARLTVKEREIFYEDLGSSNGSFVENVPVQAVLSIRPPRVVRLGTALLQIGFEAGGGPPSKPEAMVLEKISRNEALKKARNYQIGDMVARGGMGAVMAAKDLNLRRTVAMKRMLSGKVFSHESRLRFVREAEVLGMLEHPNIVPIHELGIDDQGEPFYTMKFVKGCTLHHILSEIKAGKGETIDRYSLSQLRLFQNSDLLRDFN